MCECLDVGGGGGIIGGSCHKYHFCCGKSFVCGDKTRLLSRQKYACHVCHDIIMFFLESCRDKNMFCRYKHVFVATCRDKNDTCGSFRQ